MLEEGAPDGRPCDRAAEYQALLDAVQPLITSYIERADLHNQGHAQTNGALESVVQNPGPEDLERRLDIEFPDSGQEVNGVVEFASKILGNSVSTWSQGFMAYLYSSSNAVGMISELILAVLNTNVHVYESSPALTITEKRVTKALASLFGLCGRHAGGISQQGGSAANLTALVTARNTLFPEMKVEGARNGAKSLVLFTSAGGHYSLEKAAQICGLGSAAVWPVLVDGRGRMDVAELEASISRAKQAGHQPFFVNATAGTTVLGAFDPLPEIGKLCKKEGLWFHVDASWGGAVVFSSQQRHKMAGSAAADSIAFNPHKMLNVPLTCSFLLVSDLRRLWRSSTLPASYLFHNDQGDMDGANDDADSVEMWDLADMSLQCGRRGDSLKMALGWIYYGTLGYERRIDHAFAMAAKLARLVTENEDLALVSDSPPPCLSVCFYFAPRGALQRAEHTSETTRMIVKRLRLVGFAIEHAPGEQGLMLRVVVNLETRAETVETLVREIVRIGAGMDARSLE